MAATNNQKKNKKHVFKTLDLYNLMAENNSIK